MEGSDVGLSLVEQVPLQYSTGVACPTYLTCNVETELGSGRRRGMISTGFRVLLALIHRV